MRPLMTPRLGWVQERLQRGRLWRAGNVLSSVRYRLWKLSGGRHYNRITLRTESNTASNLYNRAETPPGSERT